MRVLLIEDEPTTAKAIELMLTTEGFNVYQTDLGEEAEAPRQHGFNHDAKAGRQQDGQDGR